ncbi:MAG: hypothetical protein HY537_10720 [Deltaproteobacteria bacterium]|nr:hypothetical protein [Deltaproteobacteria bacterium]
MLFQREFDFTVVGDEPAGLWCLRELARLFPWARLGWVSLGVGSDNVLVPQAASQVFNLNSSVPWHPEILLRRRPITWSTETLKEVFPSLPQSLFNGDLADPYLGRQMHHLADTALRKHPELVSCTAAIWKRIGRTPTLSPQSCLASTLLATEMCCWNPVVEIPSTVQRMVLASDVRLAAMENRRSINYLSFTDQTEFSTRHLLFNHTISTGLQWTESCARFCLNVDPSALARQRSYSIRLVVAPQGVPTTLQPLTVLIDTDEVPDNSEIWPIECFKQGDKTELILHVHDVYPSSAESVLHKIKNSLKRAFRILPFLTDRIESFSVPLDLESCGDQSMRLRAMSRIEDTSIELYSTTVLGCSTRWPTAFWLAPNIHCHLPYPVGPLIVARALLRELDRRLGKRRIRQAGQNEAQLAGVTKIQ